MTTPVKIFYFSDYVGYRGDDEAVKKSVEGALSRKLEGESCKEEDDACHWYASCENCVASSCGYEEIDANKDGNADFKVFLSLSCSWFKYWVEPEEKCLIKTKRFCFQPYKTSLHCEEKNISSQIKAEIVPEKGVAIMYSGFFGLAHDESASEGSSISIVSGDKLSDENLCEDGSVSNIKRYFDVVTGDFNMDGLVDFAIREKSVYESGDLIKDTHIFLQQSEPVKAK